MPQLDGWEAAPAEDEGWVGGPRLGPPGWDEFSAARERFMRTVAVAGLETAWGAPAREPREGGQEEGRP
jgi:hypothetical protein